MKSCNSRFHPTILFVHFQQVYKELFIFMLKQFQSLGKVPKVIYYRLDCMHTKSRHRYNTREEDQRARFLNWHKHRL